MSPRLYDIISFLGAMQGVLLSLYFLVRKPGHPAAHALGAYLLIFSIGLLEEFIHTNFHNDFVSVIFALSNFLYGPLLYLFVEALISDNSKFTWPKLLHFIPFIAGVFITVVLPKQLQSITLQVVVFELLVVQLLTYNVLAIRRYSKSRIQHSHMSGNLFNWLKAWLLFITVVYVISFAITHVLLFLGTGLQSLYVLVQLLIAISIYSMSYKVMIDSTLFKFTRSSPMNDFDSEIRYQKSGLRPDQAAEYEQRLINFISGQKPYLNPSLTIQDLAMQLGITKNHLTEIINKRLKKNFYELINEYRIEEAKRLIDSPEYAHFTLSALGLEAGFRSKSAFNSNFKLVTGLTPSQWKQRDKSAYENRGNEVLT